MKKLGRLHIIVILLFTICSCSNGEGELIELDDLSPWCILDFDSLDRTTDQRIAMLKEMGFKKYGYNKGKGNLDEMTKEFRLAQESNIEISSIFLWLNAKRDSVGKLSLSNQKLLNNLKEVEQNPTIWLSFSNNFFKELSQEESIDLCIEMIQFIKPMADELACKLALYNHHGWFGNPHNQIKILEKLGTESITMVYNFHHAHEYVDEFPEIARKITPYLSYVNVNGVKKEGPEILTIGEGDYEYDMIKLLRKEGYNGPWGILGHIKTKDVQKVLEQNINGLKLLNAKFEKDQNKQ